MINNIINIIYLEKNEMAFSIFPSCLTENKQ